MTVAPTEID